MSEDVLITVRADDQASAQLRNVAQASKQAGDQAGRSGQAAGRGASGWVTAGNATGKAGERARDASGKFSKAGVDAQKAGAKAASGSAGFSRFSSSLDSAQRKVVSFGKSYRDALDERTTTGIDVAGMALVGAFTAATWAAANFDKQLSSLRAVTGAEAAELDQLRAAALEAGAATAFSASDAALAQTELAKAGVSTSDILGGALSGSLDLAAAGGIELGRAAEIAANAMNIFKLGGSDVGVIADTLAAGANSSAADIEGLAQSMSQGGAAASSMGMSLQDTVGLLSAFADNALVGSDGGTAMKTMLSRLAPTSGEAAAELERLGISAFDANGNFVGIAQFAGVLQEAFSDLTVEQQALSKSIIFGTDASRAADVLLKQGEKGIRSYIEAVNDQGAATDMAGKMMDNLAGDIEQLKGSVETGLIKSGSGANDVLRGMTQGLTFLTNVVSGMPTPVLAVSSAAALMAGSFLLVAPRVMAAKESLDLLAVSAPRAVGAMLTIARTAGVLAVAYGVLKAGQQAWNDYLGQVPKPAHEVAAAMDEVVESGQMTFETWKELGGGTSTLAQGLENILGRDMWNNAGAAATWVSSLGGLLPWADEAGTSIDGAAQAFENMDGALASLVATGDVGKAAAAFKTVTDEAAAQGIELDAVNTLFPQYLGALDASEKAAKAASAGADGLVGTLDDVDQSAQGAEVAVTSLTAAISRAQGFLAGQDAVLRYKAALDDFDASLKKNGKTFDDNTEKGRNNITSLSEIAKAAQDAYTATDANNNVTITNAKAYGQAAVVYYRNARALGMNAGAAADMTAQVFGAKAASEALAKVKAKPRIEADIKGLEGKLTKAKSRLAALQTKPQTAKVKADTAAAQAKVDGITRQLDILNGKAVDPEVTATTVDAETAIGRTSAALTDLDGKRVKVYIDVVQNRPIPTASGGQNTDPAGDTASPKATGGSLARTLARHSTISAGMTGMRITNLLTGGGGHGRGSGDHQAGRAIDVQGPRLGDYVRRVREAGGFAELHGTGAGRHAHAVMGDTASPRGGNTAGGDVNVSVPVQVIGRLNADEIEGLQQAITSAVGPAVSRWTQQRRERGK